MRTKEIHRQAEKNIFNKLTKLPCFIPEENTYKSNELEGESNRLFWGEVERLTKEQM